MINESCDSETGICNYAFGVNSYITPAGSAFVVQGVPNLFAGNGGSIMPAQYLPDTVEVVATPPGVVPVPGPAPVTVNVPVQTVGGAVVPIQQAVGSTQNAVGSNSNTLLLIGLGIAAFFLLSSGKK